MPIELYPVGSILPHGRATVPPGFLACDGAAVSRTGRADLFAAIGTNYGVGDGSTTFNVPSFALRFPLGSNVSAPGATGGAAAHTHTTSAHTHPATQPSDHGTHSSLGAHTHDAHTTATRTVGTATVFNGPVTHVSEGAHTHDAHSVHTSFAVNSGGAGTTGTNNPPFLGVGFIIASFNTFLVSFDVRQEHTLTRSLRVRKTHSVRQKHTVSRTLRVRTTHSVRQKHGITFNRRLTGFRDFSIRQDHALTRTLRARLSLDVRQEHTVTFARSLEAFRTFPVRQEHHISRSLRVRVTHSVRQDHNLAFARSLELFRAFNVRSDHTLSLGKAVIYVREFNIRHNHGVTARICLDINRIPEQTGGTTIIRRLMFLPDD